MITVVLMEPEHPGNIGAIARVMANFGFENLVLVNPKCDPFSDEAFHRSKHAKEILKNAKIVKKLPKYDTIVATTAQIGNDYNISRSPITPSQLSEIINNKQNIGIVFGRESSGLSNEEIQLCDFVVTIPSVPKYPVLNISHSVAVVLYELSKKSDSKKVVDNIRPITEAERKQLYKMLEQTLKKLSFTTEQKRETQRKIWKRMISRSFLSKREAMGLMGFFKKIK